jgi:hypothetical protein
MHHFGLRESEISEVGKLFVQTYKMGAVCPYYDFLLSHPTVLHIEICGVTEKSVTSLEVSKRKNNFRCVGFEVFTAVVMKSIIFWDVTQCSPLCSNLPPACSLVCWTFLRPWRCRRYVPPKRRLLHNGLHGIIFQKMILFSNNIVCTMYLQFQIIQNEWVQ